MEVVATFKSHETLNEGENKNYFPMKLRISQYKIQRYLNFRKEFANEFAETQTRKVSLIVFHFFIFYHLYLKTNAVNIF